MLGIRRYRGVAIDLYQGEIGDFACDLCLDSLATAAPAEELLLAWTETLLKAMAFGHRHLAVSFPSSDKDEAKLRPLAKILFQAVCQSIAVNAVPGLGRISIVVEDGVSYAVSQSQLFLEIPE